MDKLFYLPQEEVPGADEKLRRWRIEDTASLIMPNIEKIGLNTAKLLALYILRGVAGIYKGSTIMDDINSAFEKICTNLTLQSRKMLEQYSHIFVNATRHSGCTNINRN